MAFGLALSFYRNILFEQTLRELDDRNRILLKDIERSEQDLAYFHSEQFKDAFAKENMSRVNAGEKVLLLPKKRPDHPRRDAAIPPEEQALALFEEFLRQTPVIDHWKLYLFHHDRIEALRKGLPSNLQPKT